MKIVVASQVVRPSNHKNNSPKESPTAKKLVLTLRKHSFEALNGEFPEVPEMPTMKDLVSDDTDTPIIGAKNAMKFRDIKSDPDDLSKKTTPNSPRLTKNRHNTLGTISRIRSTDTNSLTSNSMNSEDQSTAYKQRSNTYDPDDNERSKTKDKIAMLTRKNTHNLNDVSDNETACSDSELDRL
eukprot:UN29047